MKKLRLQLLAAFLFTLGLFYVLGVAGDFDFCDQVILSMSQEEYDYVKDSLTKLNGKSPSEREIAHWWHDHHYTKD